jgi:hypothetical protein
VIPALPQWLGSCMLCVGLSGSLFLPVLASVGGQSPSMMRVFVALLFRAERKRAGPPQNTTLRTSSFRVGGVCRPAAADHGEAARRPGIGRILH